MPEYYTYKNIIAGSTQEKAKNYIGKMVYFADNPNICLLYANTNDGIHRGILRRIEVDSVFPFVIENLYTPWAFVIPYEEELSLEYVPFENSEEFLNAYYHNETKNLDGIYHCLSTCGIWLKSKGDNMCLALCKEVEDHGIGLGLAEQITLWKELLDGYEFLNGTPCGKNKRG